MNSNNNNKQTASDRRIANSTSQHFHSKSLNRSLINNNNNIIVPSGNTYSLTDFNNFQQQTDGHRNHQSSANPSNLNPNTTNFLIHSC